MTFEAIYQSHKNMVYNLALQYVQNIEDAEEITQDVFLSVFEKSKFFREEATMKTWIYRITINKSLDHIKARTRKKRFAFITSIFKSTEEGETQIEIPYLNHPGIDFENQEQFDILFTCINQLPDNQKTAIILLKIEQKSQAETAEIMDITVKAVESLLQRAKSNLSSIYIKTKEKN